VSVPAIAVFPGTYRDSLLLLSATRAMQDGAGVSWATAAMATPAAVEELTGRGFPPGDLAGADANALVLAVGAADDRAAAEALERGRAAVFAEAAWPEEEPGRPAPRTVGEAAARLPEANVAVVSVPGPYATVAAHSALSAGLHVLLFSDNVPLADEVELKERARRLGLLLMGPGAGTAMLAGVGLGFANAVTPGPVGVVAAAGTGAQEVMSLLDRWGIGVSQVIGVGGRDLSTAVGGLMAAEAVRALDADPGTEVILLVSKPPDPGVARTVIGASRSTPVVAACLGLSAPDARIGDARTGDARIGDARIGDARIGKALLADTLELGARQTAEILGRPVPGPAADLAAVIERAAAGMAGPRRAVRGFFTGGTLCYEAQVVLSRALGPVYSNIPLRQELGLPAPPGAHVCLDLGEEEYTKGRPHPMIDPAARTEIMRAEAFGDDVAAVLLDVVLGYGSHPDPAGEIAETCADLTAEGTAVIAYVLGARADRQGLDRQRRTLRDAGAIVTASAAEAARVAAAIAARQPALASAGRP
jgi:FdrA protein